MGVVISMNTILNTTRLIELEILLKNKLEKSTLLSFPFSINCFLGEVLLILVDCFHSNVVNLEKIEAFLYKILKQENLSDAYFIEIYYYINGKYCFVEIDKQPSLLEILAWEVFNKDRRIFIKQQRDLVLNWGQKSINPLNHNFKSNQLSWFVISGSLVTLILFTILYGLTRPCVFDECLEIKQAQELSDKTDSLLRNDVSSYDLNMAKINLELALELLNAIPFWSNYHQESSHLKENYQEKLNNILVLNSARDQINKWIPINKKSFLSMEKLEILKQEIEQGIETIETVKNNNFLDETENKDYQKYSNLIEKIDNEINLEKQAQKKLQQAKQAGLLAQKRENTADQLVDLQLVYNTWITAIKRLKEIPPETRVYQSSRPLLKSYLSNKTKAQQRKKQEEIAVRLYKNSNNYANLAKKAEENNQWAQAVNYWNMAVVYIKKVPQNTFKGNEIQPFVSTYNLSLSQATNKLKQLTQSKTINAELDTMCTMKQKICDYQITEELIKMKLKSQYLEQVWMTALQAKAEGNLQIKMELLNHLSTFEHRLQKISNHTGKSIEVYNAQGNLMTVYHRQQ